MPQIFVFCQIMEMDQLVRLGQQLIPVVEEGFGIQGTDDTACTVTNEVSTINEASIQVEVRYTAGHDEYNRGVPFDPTMEQQRVLGTAIKTATDTFLIKECGVVDLSLSVWCKPFYNSHFKMWKK